MANITDGTTIVDIAKAELGFNYYLYVRPGGSGIIMREKVDETEYRFYFFRGSTDKLTRIANVQTQWDDRVNKGYILPSSLGRQ